MNNATTYSFSIILPVRNGGAYLKECVASILSQTIGNFNLIILDSGSTDGTIEWLQLQTDPRIIVHLAERPLSITENWDRIRSVPRNEWMTIIGHDDILQPGYLDTVTELINRYPDASLYQTHFDLIDAAGQRMRSCKPMAERIEAGNMLDKILTNDINIYGTGFMVRSRDYDAVGGIPMYPNLLSADYVLWLELTATAYLAVSPANCFSYRINQSTTATTKTDIYIAALKLFVEYLLRSKDRLSPSEEKNAYVKRIFSFYSERVARRILTVPTEEREGLSVGGFIKETKAYAGQFLDKGQSFDPASIRGVWLAGLIDSNMLTRKLFLFVKKIHPNPLMK